MRILTILHLSGFILFSFLDETSQSFYSKCQEQQTRCYHCDSRTHPKCADPFDGVLVQFVDCVGCCTKTISRQPGDFHITRSCASSGDVKIFDFELTCENRNYYEKRCYCNSDLCNKGNYLSGMNQYFWILAALSYFMY